MTEALPEAPTPDVVIGERIHLLMRRQRMTNTALAKLLHVDQSSVSKKLLGQRPFFVAELFTISEVLGVHPAELVGGEAPEDWKRARRDSNPKPSVLEPGAAALRVLPGGVKPGLTPDRRAARPVGVGLLAVS